jgi:hypothetical protein
MEEERTFLDIIDGISREKKLEKELGSEGNPEDGDEELILVKKLLLLFVEKYLKICLLKFVGLPFCSKKF